ncbi:MAG: response regulator [Blastocatellia bacterium]|nr:response regulator [Blastocatellia bacterium]
MNSTLQLIFPFLQLYAVLFLILFAHRLRESQGLAPLFLLLGGLEIFVTVTTAVWVRFEVGGFSFLSGSTTFFAVGFTGVLLVYLCDGTLKARHLIFSIIGLQAACALWRILVFGQIQLPGTVTIAANSDVLNHLFVPDLRLNVASAIARLVALFAFVIFYQWLANTFGNWPFMMKIFLATAFALILCDTLFFTLGMVETARFWANYTGSVMTRPVTAALVSPVLAVYLRHLLKYRSSEDLRSPTDILQSNKALMTSLAESESRFENLFENANELIYVVDPETKLIVNANQHAFRTLGYGEEGIRNCLIFDLHASDAQTQIEQLLGQVTTEKGQSLSVDTVVKCADGRNLPVALRAYQAMFKGKSCVVFLANDITERKQALESLRRANQLKDELLQNVSHELRTPLTAILGWSELIVSDAIDDHHKQIGGQEIKDASEKLLQLVSDLLDLSKIEHGTMELETELEDVNSPIHAAYRLLSFAARNKGVTLKMDLTEPLPLVQLDLLRTRQIVQHLLSNAIKFTGAGGTVAIQSKSAGNFVEIAVADTGVGIRPQALPYIFNQFQQGDGSATRTFGGTGVGLALVKSLVELHGGTISVDSTLGKGSVFTVRLPVPRTGATASAPLKKQPTTISGSFKAAVSAAGKPTILIIDDDQELLKLVGTIVEGADCRTILAGSAREGLAAIRNHVPRLILLDIGMPEMDGFTAFTELRKDSRLDKTKIVALTAFASLKDRERIMKHGFDEFVPKPFKRDQLLSVLERLLAK